MKQVERQLRLSELEDEARALRAELARVKADLMVLAHVATQTSEFIFWLDEQDNSSTLSDWRPGMGYASQGRVEGKDDVELSLRWAAK